MCGKFTAMASWAEVVAFSQPLDSTREGGGGGEAGGGGNDRELTYRVNGQMPVIIWDAEQGRRRVVPMRWGYPDPKDWRRPQPIHARAETIDQRPTFRKSFVEGRRGIIVFRTFNEGEEVPTKTGRTKTVQWTVDPSDGVMRGFAFLWNSFNIPDLPAPLLACVMTTVPANELIRTKIQPNDPDPRMPAILADDDGVWAQWLGERETTPEEAKALLKTVEGVHWQAAPEKKAPKR